MEYDYRQIMMTHELRQWLEDNWPMGEEHPAKEKLQALADTLKALFAKHHLEPTDLSYTFNILTMDVLGVDFGEIYHPVDDDDDDAWDDSFDEDSLDEDDN